MAESNAKKNRIYSGIGGQAVLEGVMMKNKDNYAVAVRKPDGTVHVEKKKLSYDTKSLSRRIPFVRGIVNFIDSLSLGMDILSYSSNFMDEAEEEDGVLDKLFKKLFGKHAESVAMGLTMVSSILIAVLLFMFIPYAASELLSRYIKNEIAVLLIEGALRLSVFLIYVAAIALAKDIKRLYQYHGAEHKCINCIEQGKSLDVKNVRESSRYHKRCGTSFMLLIVVISIILCFFIRSDSRLVMMAYRLLLIPVVAGIAYEILRLAGTRESMILDIISAPGLCLQRITTKEPDDEMIEVAIASVEAVFDWREFKAENFPGSERSDS